MRVTLVKNFITKEECDQLNNWVRLGIENKWLDFGVAHGGNGPTAEYKQTSNRLTSRLYGDRFENPEFIKQLSNRIRSAVGVNSHPLISDYGKDGIVVSCTFNGGDIFKHKDPKSIAKESALRCNILTQAPESGGKLFLDSEEFPINVGDLHCYLASDVEHFVTEVKGTTPRILWMFGAYVPADEWETGKIRMQQ